MSSHFGDLLKPGARVFLKSEWGPASDHWPALSFSKRSVGNKIRELYTPGRDFIIYAGTSSAANTKDPAHRMRLLSAVSINAGQERMTWQLIPQESWEAAQAEHRGRWPYSYPIISAWNLVDFPLAASVVPIAYRQLGFIGNFGSVVEVEGAELAALHSVRVEAIELRQQLAGERANALTQLVSAPKGVKDAIFRMAQLIDNRARVGGTDTSRHNPQREALPSVETQQMLFDALQRQQNRCGLCHRPIPIPEAKGLLQMSPDRIDSTNASYSATNVHITHLGCNYAKNKFSVDEFEAWLEAAPLN